MWYMSILRPCPMWRNYVIKIRVLFRQPIEQTAIILDIQLFLNCLRQRKISIKLLFVRLYHMLFGACNGNISEVDCA